VVTEAATDLDRSDEVREMHADDERREAALHSRQHPDDPGPQEPDDDPGDDRGGGDPLLDGIFNAKWLGAQTFPDIEFTVEDLITEGSNILMAAPKAGKSFLAAGLALAVAQGGIALGSIPVKQRRVLYLALEDGKRRLQKRLRQLNRGVDLPEALELKLMVDPKDATDLIQAYLGRHQRDRGDEPPPLIIIDTFGKVKRNKPAGAEPYLHDYRSAAALKTAIESMPGASLLLIHHDRKAEAADYVDAVSGTHGVAGAMDTVLVLARERGSDGAVLKVTGRDIPEAEYALTADRSNGAVHWTIVGADLDAAKDEADRQRRDRATEAKGRNLGRRSLDAVKCINSRAETTNADLAGYLKIDRKAAGDLLRELFDREYIAKTGRGVYCPVQKSPESPENTARSGNTDSGQAEGTPESPESDSSGNSGLSGQTDGSPEKENPYLPANSGHSGLSGVDTDKATP
jgi:hypothetical protein